MKKNFYITTTLPYVNADPHIGHALEFVRADVAARFKKLQGYDVFFNTGTDEHGQKLFDAALSENITPQDYVDRNVLLFKNILPSLGVSKDVHFIRTSDDKHILAAQELWRRVKSNGYIYKKKYRARYCVGCELEKTDSELIEGRCPNHSNMELQLIDEENYFFKFSAFQDKLLKFYDNMPGFVLPETRYREIRSFVQSGLRDFSVSRLKEKMPWGIPVPDDKDHIMYVWFDALTNYISTLGWPMNIENFNKYWVNGTPTQYCGQDNLRQQSAIWQAILMSADLPTSHQIVVNGFVTGVGGIKMSKTMGNTVNPLDLIRHYGTDAFRYYVLRHIHPLDGSPITAQLFDEAYNANLANGLGNTVSRLLALTSRNMDHVEINFVPVLPQEWFDAMNTFRFDLACNFVWGELSGLDRSISEIAPYEMIKTDRIGALKFLNDAINRLYSVGLMLKPLLPKTSEKILNAIRLNKKPQNLFERKESVKK